MYRRILGMDCRGEDVIAGDRHAQVDARLDVLLKDDRRVFDVVEQGQLVRSEEARFAPLVLQGRERLVDDPARTLSCDELRGRARAVRNQRERYGQSGVLGHAQLVCLALGHVVARRIVYPVRVDRVPQAPQRLRAFVQREMPVRIPPEVRTDDRWLRPAPPDRAAVIQIQAGIPAAEQERPARGVVLHAEPEPLRELREIEQLASGSEPGQFDLHRLGVLVARRRENQDHGTRLPAGELTGTRPPARGNPGTGRRPAADRPDRAVPPRPPGRTR